MFFSNFSRITYLIFFIFQIWRSKKILEQKIHVDVGASKQKSIHLWSEQSKQKRKILSNL